MELQVRGYNGNYMSYYTCPAKGGCGVWQTKTKYHAFASVAAEMAYRLALAAQKGAVS